jgi:WbqC-like protein family
VPVRRASALGVTASDATERLVALCRAVGADTYLAGRDGARYMDLSCFEKAGIQVLYQAYKHPVYAQLHGEFVPFLSALDLLLTHGDDALAILRAGDSWSATPLSTDDPAAP